LRLPRSIRVDSGVEEGNEITPYYDPMIAKLIAHAGDRTSALNRLAAACGQIEIWPVKSNANLLAQIAADPDFLSGAVDTGFLERKGADLVTAEPDDLSAARAVATLASSSSSDPWEALSGFRIDAAPDLRARVTIDGQTRWGDGGAAVAASAVIDGHRLMFERGNAWEIAVPSNEGGQHAASASDGSVLSPMPGMITLVDVVPHQKVAKGDRLVVVEAMKMEHTLRAPFDGIVEKVTVAAGDKVSENQLTVMVGKGQD
jgi:3-methylcrotonyl-CoA carboxylase alpha subunit